MHNVKKIFGFNHHIHSNWQSCLGAKAADISDSRNEYLENGSH